MARTFSVTFLVALAAATQARAETFVIDYASRTAIDPADGFEEACLGATEAEDCPQRAALLASELVEILSTLEGYYDDETAGLFEAAAKLDEPRLQALTLRYFANRAEVPDDIWTQVKTFFFGSDATVGHPSAELLARSRDQVDQELARLYLEGRPSGSYGGSLPSGRGANDSWADAIVKDAELDAVGSFAEDQLFTPASRLLMIDRFTGSSFTDYETKIPVTGFVTDATLAEVTEHFTDLFGQDPYPPIAESQSKLEALNVELVALQERVASGDSSVAQRFSEVLAEMETLQTLLSLAAALNLEGLGASEHVYWFDGIPENLYTDPFPRAVTVGTDALLQRTVIRYINGYTSDTGEGGGSGDDDDASDEDATGGGSDGGGNQGSDDGDGAPSDGPGANQGGGGDGGCSVAHAQNLHALWGFAFVIACVMARRRVRRNNRN